MNSTGLPSISRCGPKELNIIVLVAEDDVMLADCLEDGLVDEGHVVCGVAATIADAVALARVNRPDIAILDMQMRGNEFGSDIVDRLAASGDLGQMGILYISGETERVIRHARLGHACLNKPYTLEALSDALEMVGDLAVDGVTSRRLPHGLRLLQSAKMDPGVVV